MHRVGSGRERPLCFENAFANADSLIKAYRSDLRRIRHLKKKAEFRYPIITCQKVNLEDIRAWHT